MRSDEAAVKVVEFILDNRINIDSSRLRALVRDFEDAKLREYLGPTPRPRRPRPSRAKNTTRLLTDNTGEDDE